MHRNGGNKMAVKAREEGDLSFSNGDLVVSFGGWDKGSK